MDRNVTTRAPVCAGSAGAKRSAAIAHDAALRMRRQLPDGRQPLLEPGAKRVEVFLFPRRQRHGQRSGLQSS